MNNTKEHAYKELSDVLDKKRYEEMVKISTDNRRYITTPPLNPTKYPTRGTPALPNTWHRRRNPQQRRQRIWKYCLQRIRR